jgi:hypothetical protein
MNGGIILGRASQQLVTCRFCRKPTPVEQVWRGAMCQDCWLQAGQEASWVNEPQAVVNTPQGQFVYPARVQPLMLVNARMDERGNDTNPVRTLARLIDALERLQAASEERVVEEACCYCRERAVTGDDGESSLIRLPAQGGYPVQWYCPVIQFRECDSRLAVAIAIQVQRMVARKIGH